MTYVLPSKLSVFDKVLDYTGTAYVHLDPRVNGVTVPKWFKNQPRLTLMLAYNAPIPIPDIVATEEWLSATLSFSRTPFKCRVPWSAVFAVVGANDRGMVWPESMPAEIAMEIEAATKGASKPKKAGLRLVP